jgi:outer membrane murein-binding lipoprotein Lpp
MTDTARRLFYLNEPTIESHKSAQNLCKSTEHTVVLGCYVPNKGIFLQEVSDSRLQGVMEVTAAHEMLHVAYQRMSLLEQTQLNKQLQAALQQLQNTRIVQLVEAYREQDPNVVNNELHSILGTEVRNLSSELEEHYRKYFTDRSSIVAFSERYEGVFTTLRAKAKQIASQLVTLKSTIDSLEDRVKSEEASISSARSTIESERTANPEADYSSRIAIFNNRVQSFKELVAQFNEQTNIYNQNLTAYKSLALEEKSLVESLQNKTLQQSTR